MEVFWKPVTIVPGTLKTRMAEDFSHLAVSHKNQDRSTTRYDIMRDGSVTTTHWPHKKEGGIPFTMNSPAGSWRALDTLENIDRMLTQEKLAVKRQVFTRPHLPHLHPVVDWSKPTL